MRLKAITASLFAAALLASCANEELLTVAEKNNSPINQHRVSLVQALEKAEVLMSRIDGTQTRAGSRNIKSIKFRCLPTTRNTEAIDTAFYLVNYEEGGFALLGADDRLQDIYAISNEGSLNWEDVQTNPGLQIFLDGITASAAAGGASTNGVTLPGFPGVPINPPGQPDDVVRIDSLQKPHLNGQIRTIADIEKYREYTDKQGNIVKTKSIAPAAILTHMIMATKGRPSYIDGYSMEWSKVRSTGISNGLCYSLQKSSKAVSPIDDVIIGEDNGSTNGGKIDDASKIFEELYGSNVSSDTVKFNLSKLLVALGTTEKWHNPDIYIDESTDFRAGGSAIIEGKSSKTGLSGLWIIDGYICRTTKHTSSESGGTITKKETLLHCVWGQNKMNDGYYLWSGKAEFKGSPTQYDDNDSKESDNSIWYDFDITMTIPKFK